MKLSKYIAAAAALLAAWGACAQTTKFHGEIDYTNYAFGQQKTKTGDSDWEETDGAAEYGNSSNGELTVDLNVQAANFEFNFGLKTNAGLGDNGYDGKYVDNTDDNDDTPFYQGNIRADFFDGWLSVYTGKFEDWNAGYIKDGFVLEDQYVSNLADSTMGQHFTAIEIKPQVFSRAKLIAGLPIIPGSGNGVNDDIESNWWKNLGKKAEFQAAFEAADLIGVNFSAGFRPGTYYTSAANAPDSTYLTNYFGEGFLQAVLVDDGRGLSANATYDIRYRKDASYTKTDLTTEEHFASAHSLSLSATAGYNLLGIEGLTLSAEDRIFYADDDFTAADEKLLHNVLALKGVWNIPGSQWALGGIADFIYAVDARGTAFTASSGGAKVVSDYMTDAVSMGVNKMNTASVDGLSGESTQYMTLYFNPYLQRNFTNGYVRLGFEYQYSQFKNDNQTNKGTNCRVPLGICFSF